MEAQPLLSVEHLVTSFRVEGGRVRAIDDVTFEVGRGRTLAIVGESGCGKSVTALSIMRLIPHQSGTIEQGRIVFNGEDLLEFGRDAMRSVRGNRISMIFQEPMTALNPVFTVGQQIMEVFQIHRKLGKKEARREALRMLKQVSIPDPERRIDQYPFEMSGGMRQRIMIAMALACEPLLLIADEPTTALDVTIQAQILRLMKDLQKRLGTSIIFITHDLGVVAEIADDVAIMYGGRIVERGDVFDIFERPRHPYTKGLMAAMPKLDQPRSQRLATIKGTVPSLRNMPEGCRFNTRCPKVSETCLQTVPALKLLDQNRLVACHHLDDEPGDPVRSSM